MPKIKVFCFGFGQVAKYFVKKIIKEGGFVRCGWDGRVATEAKIKEETKASIRCIPFDESPDGLTCILSGRVAEHEAIFAKAY